MRHLLLLLASTFVVCGIVRADEATDLRDRVLKAHAKDGGDLKKFRVHTLKAKGISKLGDQPLPATWDVAAVWPGEMRLVWGFSEGEKKSSFTLVISGDQGWRGGTGNPTEELSIEVLNDIRTDAYAIWVATLTTLKDAENKLSAVPGTKVNGEPAFALKVSRRPWPDITLYFDEKSALLRKMAYRSREAGVFLNKEFVYDGHKEVSGLIVPTKQTTLIQGREVGVWTEIEYAFPDRIDPKMFAKP